MRFEPPLGPGTAGIVSTLTFGANSFTTPETDVYTSTESPTCVLELDSSDHVPRAALLGAPLNPTRVHDEIALQFRASGKQGYGVSPQMARRCFERMDAEAIAGSLRVVYGL